MSQQIVNGLTSGVLFALVGMGFSMVWATAKTLNFAYGVMYTAGAYCLYVVAGEILGATHLGVPLLILVLAVSLVFGALLGLAIDRAVFRPLRGQELAPLFASVGISIVLENAFVKIFGSAPVALDFSSDSLITVGSVRFTPAQLFVLAASVCIMIVLQYVVSRTRFGRAMRATAWNRSTVQLMGINPNRIIAAVFAIAGILAVWAGVFAGLFYGTMTPYMGSDLLTKGLAAAVLGGFGYIPGAIVGGLLVGLLGALGTQLSTSGNWSDVLAYGVMILVIIVRPQGLLKGKGAIA